MRLPVTLESAVRDLERYSEHLSEIADKQKGVFNAARIRVLGGELFVLAMKLAEIAVMDE